MKSRILQASLRTLFVAGVVLLVSNATRSQNPHSRISGVAPAPVAKGLAISKGHLPPGQMLRLTFVVQPPQQDQLNQLLRDLQDPKSPRFHQFITFNEWKARFAPSDAAVATLNDWAQRNGFRVLHNFRNNMAVKVEADTATVEKAFDVQINQYEFGTRKFFANDRDPALPAELTGILKNVHGLESYRTAHSARASQQDVAADKEPIYKPGPFVQERHSHQAGSGRNSKPLLRQTDGHTLASSADTSFSASTNNFIEAPDLFSSEAYDLAGLNRVSQCCNPNHNPGGTPKETSIAIIGTNSIAQSDLQIFASQYGMAYNLTEVQIDSPSCCDNEMTLDIEWSTAFANSFGSFEDTAHVYAYEGGGSHLSDLLDAWDKAHSDDNARNASSSFGSYEDNFGGIGDPSISDFTDIINAMAAEGWSIAVATGDHGATQDCSNYSVTFPASSPNVLAVGGTNLNLANNSGKPKFTSENPWNGPGCGGNPGANQGGGGGGCASTEPRGTYQEIVDASLCGGVKRSMPDVALNAANGQATYYGSWTGVGGTSIASPEVGGYFAQVNSYLLSLGNICGDVPYDKPCAPLGLPNNMVWLMGLLGAPTGRQPFYDIKASAPFSASTDCIGGDGGKGLAAPYCAADGYDQATGWGSFNMLQLAWGFGNSLAHGTLPGITFAGPNVNAWYNGDLKVSFSVISDKVSGTNAAFGALGYGAQWDKVVDDTANPGKPGSGNTFYDGPPNLGSFGTLGLAAAGEGCHTAHVRGWDRVGYATSDETYGPVCYDVTPPKISCGSSDFLWHASDVSLGCTASDALSGLANPADASFSVSTSVPANTETSNAVTGTHIVCDNAANCSTSPAIANNMVDKKPPVITISIPTTTQYIVKQPVPSNYSCVDGGSGLATCVGPVANGANIDTATVGSKTFTVSAKDNVANASSSSVAYAITYRICLQYNPALPFTGRAATITLQLCDFAGNNVSQSSIVLTATAVDGSASKLISYNGVNPGNRFAYGPPISTATSYRYVLDAKSLNTGAHVISFVVAGDPIPHAAAFTVKK